MGCLSLGMEREEDTQMEEDINLFLLTFLAEKDGIETLSNYHNHVSYLSMWH